MLNNDNNYHDTRTPHNSPDVPSFTLPDNDKLFPEERPVTNSLTISLDDHVIRNWWAAYHLYVLNYSVIDVFYNTIVLDWRQRFPDVASHLTHNQLGKVLGPLHTLDSAQVLQILTAELKACVGCNTRLDRLEQRCLEQCHPRLHREATLVADPSKSSQGIQKTKKRSNSDVVQ